MQLLVILVIISLIPLIQSDVGNCPIGCIYSFTNPKYPSFTMPAAQPNSPGDTTVNSGNPIIFANQTSIAAGQGCNSVTLYALVSNTWTSTYTDSTASTSSFSNAIYASGLNIIVRTIQSNQANLASFLAGLPLKLDLTCNNGVTGCIYFTVGGTSSSSLPSSVSCAGNIGGD